MIPRVGEAGAERAPCAGRFVIVTAGPGPGVGASPAWQSAVEALRAAARAPSHTPPVLIHGEPGTGKELSAFLLHRWSDRAEEPFVSFDPASVAPELVEGEILGHAATGARGNKRGLLELASGGTLFLDDVSDLPLASQPRLLRLLEGHPVRRVGEGRETHADVRFVFATRGDLAESVRAGRLLRELHQRLQAVELTLPPLRERGDDVELLAHHFASRLSAAEGTPGAVLSPDALAALHAYAWPGNVRELRLAIERAVLRSRDGDVRPADLPCEVLAASLSAPVSAAVPRLIRLEDVIRRHVIEVFRASRDNVTRTALALGISRVALRRRLREYGVKPRP